ncbi:MAG: alpha/beta fold hydrolase [Ardenticatenaceae bacterium]|nr:alpha/beta fold hydrolase [Ardenticatenaceae bacterium]
MRQFRRVLSWLFFIAGIVAGVVVAVVAFFVRYLVKPPRQPLWATPNDLGMDYEEVQFPARDGVRLAGWFVPGKRGERRGGSGEGATLIMVHGWPWNRLGEAGEDFLARLGRGGSVDLLRLAYVLHQEGYNLLMFDLRNHGESAAAAPVTFGKYEVRDLLGVLDYLRLRPDVDNGRIGAIGFSMGGNTVLYGLAETDGIQAAVAVQPTSPVVFAKGYARDLMGVLGAVVLPLVDVVYRLVGGVGLGEIRPSSAMAQAGDTPVLFVQGDGDEWGSVADVAQIAAAASNPVGPLVVKTSHRFGGYRYVVDNPKLVTAFFEQHL